MDAKDKAEKRSGAVWIIAALIVVLVVLPVLYVLSIGPAEANYSHDGPDAPQWLITFYGPIRWVNERSEWARDICGWYIALWVNSEE